MEHFKLFGEHTNYETFISGKNKELPILSYCEDHKNYHFNHNNYNELYLTI